MCTLRPGAVVHPCSVMKNPIHAMLLRKETELSLDTSGITPFVCVLLLLQLYTDKCYTVISMFLDCNVILQEWCKLS